MTTTTHDQTDDRTPGPASRRRRRGGALLAVAGTLLLVLVSRTLTSGDTFVSSIAQRSCQGHFCVERVHSPDLLFVPGSDTVRVVPYDAEGHPLGRILSVDDPFSGSENVSIAWPDGGVRLSDSMATLSWS